MGSVLGFHEAVDAVNLAFLQERKPRRQQASVNQNQMLELIFWEAKSCECELIKYCRCTRLTFFLDLVN